MAMGFGFTLIDMAGTVALLLWGVRMVQTGVQRAFGPNLRGLLERALQGRLRAFAAGVGVTAVVQSSTATGLMVAGFASLGLVGAVPALAVLLGAGVGTTLIVQVLSFHVAGVAPALFLAGFVMFRRGASERMRDLGRVAIGLGLMLLSLHLLVGIVTPFEDAPGLRMVLGVLAGEPVLALLLAAVVTWAAHSSIAIVLLVMSLAAKGAVPEVAALAMVLGANLGTAVNPILEGGAGDDPVARRLSVGNFALRAAGCVAVLAVLEPVSAALVGVVGDAGRLVALFHSGFNLALAAVMLPLLGPYARLLRLVFPDRMDRVDPGRPVYLREAAREVPGVAIGAAAREALRLADVLDAMLAGLREALARPDRRPIAETRRLDDVIDRLNTAIKAYLTGLDAAAMGEADHRRVEEILVFAHNLEHAADVVERDLMGAAAKRLKRGLAFAAEDEAVLLGLVERVQANLHAAAAVFMAADVRAARALAAEKEVFRDAEERATQAHFARLRVGLTERAEAGALHLDVLRDLKQVNAHLVAASAYPVLKHQGELLASRVREVG
jgi:phosphate:Na+ symporter